MPSHRLTFEFGPSLSVDPAGAFVPRATQGAVAGWTETFYSHVNDTDERSLDAGVLLLAARRRLLTVGWRCLRIRTSRFPLTRVAARRILPPAEGIGQYEVAAGAFNDEQPWDAINIAINSDSGRSRAFLMRGIGSNVITPGGVYRAPAAFAGGLPLFEGRLRAGFDLRVTTTTELANLTGLYVVAVPQIPATRQNPILRFSVAPALDVGDQLRVQGFDGVSGFRGLWTIQSINNVAIDTFITTLVTLRQKRNKQVGGLWTGGGRVWRINPTLSAITGISPGDGASRRTGGPSTRRRGRRSNRTS